MTSISQQEYHLLQKSIYEESYYEFFKAAWPAIEPEPLQDNFHIKFLCDRLDKEIKRFLRGERKEKDIIINIPPRTLKSSIVSVFLTAWVWALSPKVKFICASYSSTISENLNMKCINLIRSEWYQKFWGNKVHLIKEKVTDINTDKGGQRYATSTTGSCTGLGCDIFIYDDILNAQESASEASLYTSTYFYKNVSYSRLNNQERGLRIVVMQRLHEDDLTGYLLQNEPDKWDLICLPATDEFPIVPQTLQKFYRNGNLFPERLSDRFLSVVKTQSTYPGQYGQQPMTTGGNMFKSSMFEEVEAEQIPAQFDYLFTTVDTTYSDKQMNDYTVFMLFGVYKEQIYILSVFHEQIKSIDIEERLLDFLLPWRFKWGYRYTFIEPKGHGIYLNQKFSREGIIVPPPQLLTDFYKDRTKDKVTRANSALPHLAFRTIKLDKRIPIKQDIINECLMFPNAKHDDLVDCICDGLKYVYASQVSILDVL